MKQKGLITFLGGAIVGAGLTWLFTSKQGKELVEKVKSKGDHLKDELLKELKDLSAKIDKRENTDQNA